MAIWRPLGVVWGSIWGHFGLHFGLIFGPREPLKIMLSLWRGAIFRKNGMTRPGAQNGAPNDPQIEPQTTPRGFQIAQKITPNQRLMFGQISAPFWTILGGPKSVSYTHLTLPTIYSV